MPSENKNVPELFRNERIPYSQLFEIDEIADKSTGLPHMMASNEVFISFMKKMDVRKSDHIICYDRSGIFSAPRVWLTFKLFGTKNVSILNGGFPKWFSENLPLEKGDYLRVREIKRNPPNSDDFDYNLDKSKILNVDEILLQSAKQFAGDIQEHIIDCRAGPRYKGEVEEPRPTLRKGHVLTASNVFFKDLLNSQSCYKTKEEIKKEFENKNVDIEKKLTLYCGSGITASVNIFALAMLGKFENCRIYDGSWAEMVSLF
jgi:thiosulfate/3-mercaptopyruvate sulfurtransferase